MLAPPGENICFLQIEAWYNLYYFTCIESAIVPFHNHNFQRNPLFEAMIMKHFNLNQSVWEGDNSNPYDFSKVVILWERVKKFTFWWKIEDFWNLYKPYLQGLCLTQKELSYFPLKPKGA